MQLLKEKIQRFFYCSCMKKVHGLSRAFGKVLSAERIKQNLSQEELAEKIGSGNVYISLLENGKRQPSLNAVVLLAEALNIRPEELTERVSDILNR